MMRATPIPPGPGQESVWDYPRPPRLEPCPRRIKVVAFGQVIAETTRAFRLLETSHPPNYYLPPADVRMPLLEPTTKRTWCEWKGNAVYFDVVIGDNRIREAAWAYPHPTPSFAPIRDYLAFYPGRMESCWVDEEQVQPQAGGFYGGWITGDIVGPFKGEPGTMGW